MNQKTLEERLLYPQRAVRYVELTPGRVAFALAAAAFADFLLVTCSSQVFALWRWVFALSLRVTGLPGRVYMEPLAMGGVADSAAGRFVASMRVPILDMSAHAPDFLHWAWLAWVTVMLVWVSTLLSERFMPGVYLMRFLAAVEVSSLAYFAWMPARFIYGVSHFARTEVYAAYAVLLLIPPMLALCYFLLEFSVGRKLGLLAATLAYVMLAVPVQVTVCSILSVFFSLAVLPVFYLAIGPILFVAWFVAFFGWGMSWQTEAAA